ncbi:MULTISPECIES: TAXI family TRAP transporter solute-binding subunit [Cloacibacillus]|jgi:uncharacterized protein|uniref:C4-dicarboxylate ABC transporter substrate-binding protein n=2 Tax=Cloacibacillus TaxID=508459 RepID=A0A1B2I2E8_9BACT|nr:MULTISPECIES: TAXI family TRAP transporter solute-binding subunit [Cloacibacillus]ANZ44148.1 hypothetical protein BED41_03020 [Cloacibacillus porcorum]EHL67806.1 TAXI family TRAP transporter solute receptor [Synergistes sp. 3_1_syn1]MCQ4814939.1 TAXI family TRAP transporter solute-binding subunit [Cloacibacillus evryensis]
MFNRKMKMGFLSFVVFSLLLATVMTANAKELSMGTGGTAGTFFPLGGAIANTINKHSKGINVTVQTTDGSVNNAHLLGKGDIDVALIQTDITYYAYNGMEMFKNKYPNLTAICRVYPDTTHIIAKGDGSIKSISDLKGRSVSVGAPGSGNEVTLRQILGTAGITYKDLKPFYLSFSESSEHFKDGHIDAFHTNSSVPAAIVHDLNSLNRVTLLPVGGKLREDIVKKYPFYTPVTVPANTYKYQTAPYETVAVQALLIVDSKLPEDIVYGMTKALFENLDEVKTAHSAAKGMSLKTALDGVAIPLHPGAKRYFMEKGVLK